MKQEKNNLKCNHCGYRWKAKLKDRLPKSCPICKQYNKIEEIKQEE